MSRVLLLVPILLASACGDAPAPVADEPTVPPVDVNAIARDYVVLELAMGEIDGNHVDAYSGPEGLKTAAIDAGYSLADIDVRASRLERALAEADESADARRVAGLLERLRALRTRVAMNAGERFQFDEESERLFGAQAPDRDDAYFEAILTEIDALLPGEGALAERVNAFRERFMIPPDKLDVVFETAMAECRQRTLERIALPDDESFRVEYVSDKPWSGYNWYQGDAESLIQVNIDLPTSIDRAVDLGCHEGYPGHHTYNVLLERELADGRGWVEFTLYPLFSPQSLIAEGSANYGIDLAFPGDERVTYEREVLFPLASLDAAEADRYYALQAAMAKLSYAGNEAARDYLNGERTREETEAWLVRYALSTPERAAQRVRFFDTYRSYVINYNLGKDLVAAWIERDGADEATRWARFEQLLSMPSSAADLR